MFQRSVVSHLCKVYIWCLLAVSLAQEQEGGASTAPASVPPAAGASALPPAADLMKTGLRHVRHSALQALDYSVPLGTIQHQC
jgi:hypothetical protein